MSFHVDDFYYEGTNDLSALIFRNAQGQQGAPGSLPSQIEFYPSGNLKCLEWYRAGKLHREKDLPAIVRFKDSPALDVTFAMWCINGGQHREGDGPSAIQISETDGRVSMLMYCRHGEETGWGNLPYFIQIEPDGRTKDEDGNFIDVDLSVLGENLPRPPPVAPPPFITLG